MFLSDIGLAPNASPTKSLIRPTLAMSGKSPGLSLPLAAVPNAWNAPRGVNWAEYEPPLVKVGLAAKSAL